MTGCSAPPPLSDDDLLAMLDGDAPTAAHTHLKACAHCSARLEAMRKFEQQLQTVMHRADCPPAGDLADYVIGVIGAGNRREMERHLERCARCRQETQYLQMMFAGDEALAMEKTGLMPLWDELKGLARRLEDQLVMTLVPQPIPAYGQLRGAADRERLLNYEHGAITVMLRLGKVADGLKVNGAIIDSESEGQWAGSHAELSGAGAEGGRFLAVIDDEENFTFDRIPPGAFYLSIYAAGGRVARLSDLDLTL